MSANLGAHSVKGGFNQSGGSMFMVLTDLSSPVNRLNVLTPGTGSGGAATAGTMTVTAAATIAPGLASAAAAVGAGKLIKDMGKSVVVNNVTYRKFQTVQTPSAVVGTASAGGQMGKTPDYYSFYLEVAREGFASSANGPAQIVRYC